MDHDRTLNPVETRETLHYQVHGEYEDGTTWETAPFEYESETMGTPLEQAESYLAGVTGPDSVAPSARSRNPFIRAMTGKGHLMPNRWAKIRVRPVEERLGAWEDRG